MALRKRLITVGALAVTAAMLMTSCASDSDKRDRGDDEEETAKTSEAVEVVQTAAASEAPASETRASETSVAETSAAPVVDETAMTAAYVGVLTEYDTYLRMLEQAPYSQIESCAYTDLTGDGLPELVIQYASDAEHGYGVPSDYYVCADMRFYTYDFGAGQVIEMAHIENTIMNAGGGFNADAVLLSNGNVIVTTGWGDEDSELFITEYAIQNNQFVQVNDLYHGQFLQEDNDDYYYTDEYELNGVAISEEEYNEQREAYVASFDTVLAMSPFYTADWYEPGEWVNGILNADNAMFWLDDLYAMLAN